MSLLVLGFGLVGCQRLPQYPTREGLDGGFGSANITLGTDECPGVTFTATPGETRIGQPVTVAASASDVELGTAFTYAWTASSGFFLDPSAASTTYICPGRDHAGPQTITASVADGTCVTSKTATILCVALADGGGPATVGPGPGSGADAGISCAHGDPTKCEGESCNDCTNANCETLATAAAQETVPIAGCDFFVSDADVARCQRLYACMRDSGCVENSDPTKCWCGTVDPYECETGMTPPDGPCAQQFNDAAGSSDATVINDRLTDSRYPLGGAINLAACRSVYCSQLSDPPNPVCAL